MPGNAFVPRAVDLRSGFGVEPIIPRHSDAFGQQDTFDRRCLRCRVVCSVEWFVPSLTPTHPMTKPSGGEAERLLIIQVGMTGFEPATSWSQTRRSSQAELHPVRHQSRGSRTTRQLTPLLQNTFHVKRVHSQIRRPAAAFQQSAQSHRWTRNQ